MRIRASTFIAVSFLSLMTSCGYRIGLTTADMALRNEYGGEGGVDLDVAGNLVFVVDQESAEIRLYQRASDGKSSLLKRSRVAIGSPFCSNLGRRG